MEELNFADPIYAMANPVLQLLEEFWPYPEPRGIVKDGRLLQLLGTEWGRNSVNQNLWVDILKKRVNDSDANLIFIGDCRFENEANAFPEALRIRLEADKATRKERANSWREDDTHPSEVGLDYYEGFDVTIDTTIIRQTFYRDWETDRKSVV